MILKELIAQITEKQNLKTQKLFLKEIIEMNASSFGVELEPNQIENISTAIYFRLFEMLDWELLYLTYETNYNTLFSLINQHLPYILSKVIKYSYQLKQDFLKGDKTALSNEIVSDGSNQNSYSGFGLENQDGEFNNSKNNSKVIQTDYLNFINYLGNDLENWTEKLTYEIKQQMCISII